MTSSFLANVKMYLFSIHVKILCDIFWLFPHKRISILEQIMYKKSDIKNLIYCYYFMDYHLAF